MLKKPIVLVGLPGAGKTTIGHRLAQRLSIPYIDADQAAEEQLGQSIRSFFEKCGESAFRDVEEQILCNLLQGDSSGVISTGGGVVLREANRRLLKEQAFVIYLNASPDELFRRLRNDQQRPLLQVADPLHQLHELKKQRDPLYREVAHFIADTTKHGASHQVLVSLIISQLELAGYVFNAGN